MVSFPLRELNSSVDVRSRRAWWAAQESNLRGASRVSRRLPVVHSARNERIYPFSHGALSHRLRGRLEGRKQLSSGGRGRNRTGLRQLWQSASRTSAARIEAREARDRILSLGLRLSRGGAAHSPRAARGSVLLRSRSAGVWSASRDVSAARIARGPSRRCRRSRFLCAAAYQDAP